MRNRTGGTDTYERSLPEQIRDAYLDGITDVILASPFKGSIRIALVSELERRLETPGDGVTQGTVHMSRLTPTALATILATCGPDKKICIYI